MKKDKDRKIEDLGIYELRVLAREVGVQSPTSKKREMLISEIYSILEGEKDPYTKKDGRGRPSKGMSNIGDFANVLIPSNINYDLDNSLSQSYEIQQNQGLVFRQNYAQYENGDEQEVSGIIDRNRMGVTILRVKKYDFNENDVFVNPTLVQQYNLREGDYVEGVASFVDYEHPRILNKILTINEQKSDNFQHIESRVISNSIQLKIDNKTILQGKRNIWFYEGRPNLHEKGLEISQKLQETDGEIFYVSLNDLDCSDRLEIDNFHYIPVHFVKEDMSRILTTKLVFDRANVLAQSGKKIVVVLTSLSILLKASIKTNLDMKMMTQKIKEYLSYSKSYDNGGSFTILCLEANNLPKEIKDYIDYDYIDIFHSVEMMEK